MFLVFHSNVVFTSLVMMFKTNLIYAKETCCTFSLLWSMFNTFNGYFNTNVTENI